MGRREPGARAPYLAEFAALFAGRVQVFSVPCAAAGTPFQQRVWQRLMAIGYGATLSYGELAAELGNPNASRAVGAAVGRNPLSIIIPCHRVVGRDGRLAPARRRACATAAPTPLMGARRCDSSVASARPLLCAARGSMIHPRRAITANEPVLELYHACCGLPPIAAAGGDLG